MFCFRTFNHYAALFAYCSRRGAGGKGREERGRGKLPSGMNTGVSSSLCFPHFSLSHFCALISFFLFFSHSIHKRERESERVREGERKRLSMRFRFNMQMHGYWLCIRETTYREADPMDLHLVPCSLSLPQPCPLYSFSFSLSLSRFFLTSASCFSFLTIFFISVIYFWGYICFFLSSSPLPLPASSG